MKRTLGPGACGVSQDTVSGAIMAIQSTTNYAQASITLIPRLAGLPDWYCDIQAAIDTAQSTSQTWVTVICPALSKGLPQRIVKFSADFTDHVNKILAVLAEIGSSGPTSSQKAAITSGLKALESAAEYQADQALVIRKQLGSYQTQLTEDVSTLGQAVSTLEAHLADGSQYVKKLEQAYGQSFVDVQSQISPCSVIVMLNMDVQVSVSETGAPQEAIAIVVAQTIVGALSENQANSFTPVQVVMDSWGTVQAKISAVISDVEAAQSDYIAVLKEFDLAAARDQWAELAEYASRFLPKP
ncbi:MAG: HBL/NHE enterotoxin family protein [Halioglobus sp.]